MNNKELDIEIGNILSNLAFIKDIGNFFGNPMLLIFDNFLCKHLSLFYIFLVNLSFSSFYMVLFFAKKVKKNKRKRENVNNYVTKIVKKMTAENIEYLEKLQEKEEGMAYKIFVDIFCVELILNILNEAINKSSLAMESFMLVLLISLFLISISIILINSEFNSELFKLRRQIINKYHYMKRDS